MVVGNGRPQRPPHMVQDIILVLARQGTAVHRDLSQSGQQHQTRRTNIVKRTARRCDASADVVPVFSHGKHENTDRCFLGGARAELGTRHASTRPQHTAHTTYYIAPSATHIPGLGHSSRYRLVLATCRADSWNDVVLDGTNQSVRGHGQPSQGVSHRGNGAASLTEDPEGRRKHCGGHQQPPKRGRQLQGRHKAFPLCTMQYHAVPCSTMQYRNDREVASNPASGFATSAAVRRQYKYGQ